MWVHGRFATGTFMYALGYSTIPIPKGFPKA